MSRIPLLLGVLAVLCALPGHTAAAEATDPVDCVAVGPLPQLPPVEAEYRFCLPASVVVSTG